MIVLVSIERKAGLFEIRWPLPIPKERQFVVVRLPFSLVFRLTEHLVGGCDKAPHPVDSTSLQMILSLQKHCFSFPCSYTSYQWLHLSFKGSRVQSAIV